MSGSRLARDTAIYAIGNIAVRAGALLLIPIQTHWLSISDYGVLATLYVTLQILHVWMSVGMRDAFIRFELDSREQGNIGLLFGTTTWITLAAGTAITGISVLLLDPVIQYLTGIEDAGQLVALTTVAALAFALYLHVTNYYRANLQPLRFLVAGLASVVLLLAANWLLVVQWQWGIKGAMAAYLGAYAISSLVVLVDVIPKTGFGFSASFARPLIQFGLPLVFAMFGKFVMSSSGVYFLSRMAGSESVAIYSLGGRFAQILDIVLLFPFQLAFAPLVFRNVDNQASHETIARQVSTFLGISAVVCFGLLFVSRPLIAVVAPPEYSIAFLVTVLSLPAFVFKGIAILGEVTLSLKHRTKTIGWTVTLSAALCLFLNYLLTPSLGWMGVVLATNLTYGLSAMILVGLGHRAYPLPIKISAVAAALVVHAFLVIAFYGLAGASNSIFIIGALIVFVLSLTIAWTGGLLTQQNVLELRGWVGAAKAGRSA